MTDGHHIEPAELVKAPKLWMAKDLKPAAPMQWVANRRLPRSAVSLLVGDEGIGKSLLWVLLVAYITTGREFPGFGIPCRDPGYVLIVVTEDDWSSTVRPRLEAAGADLDYIVVICEEEDGSGAPIFPRDMPLVTAAIKQHAPVLVVVDAWLDTVPSGYNVKDPQHARLALHPWREIATAGDLAVLLLTHTNRMSTGNARDKYGATAELRKKARMTLFAQLDGEGALTVGPEKSNLVGGVPASTFHIVTQRYFEPTEDNDGTIPVLRHMGDAEHTAREILALNHASAEDTGESIDAWLLEMLKDGPVNATTIYSAADANGYSKDQAKRAKARLGIDAEKVGGGPWVWVLNDGDGVKGAGKDAGTPTNHSAAPLPPSRSEGVSKGAIGTDHENKGARERGSETRPPRTLGVQERPMDENGFWLEPDLSVAS